MTRTITQHDLNRAAAAGAFWLLGFDELHWIDLFENA